MYITDTQILYIFVAVVVVFAVVVVIVMVIVLIICCHRRREPRRRLDGLPSLENPGHCCDRRRWGLAQEAEAIIPKGEHMW